MINPKEIRQLAGRRLQEAQILCENGMYDGAFYLACKEKGRPILMVDLKEAYPGDITTSYIVRIKADWIDHSMSMYEVLDFLFDVLWETTIVETSQSIFTIQVLNIGRRLHPPADKVA